MANDIIDQVAAKVHKGEFKAALALFSQQRPDSMEPELAVVRSEILHRLGKFHEAVDLATNLLQKGHLSASQQSRCYMVLGSVLAQRQPDSKFESLLRKAVQLAEDSGDIEALCKAQQRLFSFLSDRNELSVAAALLPDLRSSVIRYGQPQATAHLHASLARIEAGRGLWDRAQHRLRFALELLADDPNVWLEGLIRADGSAIAHMASDFRSAVQFARDALVCAGKSGALLVELSALANLAWAYASLWEFENAEAAVLQGLRAADDSEPARGALLDTEVHLRMYRGDWQKCEELLSEISDRFTVGANRSSWLATEILVTRARVLCYQRSWTSAKAAAVQGLTVALERGDRYPELALRALVAESMVELGQESEASDAISALLRRAQGSSRAILTDTERVKAKAFRLVRPEKAARGFERALRLAQPVGHVRGVQEAVTDYVAWLRGSAGSAVDVVDVGSTVPSSGVLYQSTPLSLRVDAASHLALKANGDTVDAERFAALFDLHSDLRLFAYEAFQLVHDSGCAEAIALVAKGLAKQTDIVCYAGWSYRQARVLAAQPKDHTIIRLGISREQRYELIIHPKVDLESRCAAIAIEKLIKASLALRRLRKDEEERASLWPMDDVNPGAQGVFVATSMTEILATAKRIAPTMLPVLLTGETGTGKEVLARTIHHTSPRANRPFVPFNCAAVPRDMVESQLFGYRRGAFTGAEEAFSGIIRGATGGTLLLDEVGDLSPEVQPKLLRFLETGEIHPLGDAQPIQADVRVIAATNANLDKLVAEGRFREDLFYRLNVIRFRLPPLRERREEIPPLVHHFVRRFTDEFRKGRVRLTEETMEYLLLYRWPGNVRQLENELRRVIALAENDQVLTPAHLSPEIRESRRTVPVSDAHAPAANEMVVRMDQPLAAAVESLERQMIQRAIEQAHGHVTEAAKMLGISRKGLFLMRKRWGIGEKGSSIQSAS